jgi:fatty acid desaturase
MRDWVESNPVESVAGIPRRRLVALHVGRTSWNLPAFLLPGLWILAGLVVVRFPTPAVRLAGYLVMGAAIAAMDVVMHEAAHGHLYRSARLNRWIGFLFGAPGLVSISAYRLFHLRHHRQPLSLSASEALLNGTPAYVLGVPIVALREANRRARSKILLEYGLLTLVGSVLFASSKAFGFWPRLAQLWFVPLGVSILITSVRGWTETAAAYLVKKPADLSRRPWCRPFYRLACDHLEHHLFPGVPWRNLRSLGLELARQYELRGTGKSYLSFLWGEVEGRACAALGRRDTSREAIRANV